MTESEMYQNYVRKFLKSKGFYTFRIEHERIPDVYCSKNNKVIWLELKSKSRFLRKEGMIEPDWRPGQLSWMLEQKIYGTTDIFCLCLYYQGEYKFLPPKQMYSLEELEELNDYRRYFQ